MAGRPSGRIRSKEPLQEMNILPIMNVFMILVPFLLLTAAFIQLAIVDTSLPARGKSVSSQDVETPKDKPKLNLTVFLQDDGFILAGFGGVLQLEEVEKPEGDAEEGEAPPAAKRFTIEKKTVEKDGKSSKEYDWDRLQGTLKKVKDAFPNHYSIILLPDNEISYETIVKMMDVSREFDELLPDGTKTKKWLFPSPVLAWAVK